MINMDNVSYNNWDKWYRQILDDFNFSRADDEKSAITLNNIIMKKGKFNMHDVSLKDKCIVLGAGPSIKKDIQTIKQNNLIDKYTLIVADGATTACLEEEIMPDIIVTDLDGKMESIIKANQAGSILYVHAHGDNIDKIQKYVPQLNKIIPTTQSKPHGLLENYGGFTDGDRAVHIATYSLNMKEILLAGMDFGDTITKYSRPEIKNATQKADKNKKLKLEYAQKLIESLKKNNNQLIIKNIIKIL